MQAAVSTLEQQKAEPQVEDEEDTMSESEETMEPLDPEEQTNMTSSSSDDADSESDCGSSKTAATKKQERPKAKKDPGRWTTEEHILFLKGLEIHGKSWKKISEIVKTRTVVQIRTHAQKYLIKLEKAKKIGVKGVVMMDGKGIINSTKRKDETSMLMASADRSLGEVAGVIHTQAVPAAAAAPLPLPSNLTALNPSAQPRSSTLSQDLLLSSTFLIPPPPIPSSLPQSTLLNSSSSLSLLAPLTCSKSLTDRAPVSLLELDKFRLLSSGPMTASKASSTAQNSSLEAKGAADKSPSINALSPIRRSLPSLDLATLGQWKNHHSTYSTAVQSIGSMTIPEALYNLNPLTESKSNAASEAKPAKTSKDQASGTTTSTEKKTKAAKPDVESMKASDVKAAAMPVSLPMPNEMPSCTESMSINTQTSDLCSIMPISSASKVLSPLSRPAVTTLFSDPRYEWDISNFKVKAPTHSTRRKSSCNPPSSSKKQKKCTVPAGINPLEELCETLQKEFIQSQQPHVSCLDSLTDMVTSKLELCFTDMETVEEELPLPVMDDSDFYWLNSPVNKRRFMASPNHGKSGVSAF